MNTKSEIDNKGNSNNVINMLGDNSENDAPIGAYFTKNSSITIQISMEVWFCSQQIS